jgi:2-oxoglutarate ferredoxin oxidoreductase subunit delta
MPENTSGNTQEPPDAGRLVTIVVYEESCKACGLCIDLCPTKVFDDAANHRMPVVARLADCTGCKICEFLCPDWAISVEAGGPADA